MKQAPLFDDGVVERESLVAALGVSGSAAKKLSKDQKLFNRLIAKIEAMRRELAQWQAFMPVYQRRFTAEVTPLNARFREKRIAMVRLLDKAMEGKALSRAQKAKVADILIGQLSELLAEAHDAELERLHDQYSDVSFKETQQDDMDFLRALAGDAFGADLDDDIEARTPDELAQIIGKQMHAKREEQASEPERKRKKNAKAVAQDALREQAAEGASKAVREVYRKLASELHPDREADSVERARKTALMQQVNRAYQAGDLLALLELQLQIEQIDAAALANMAKERLAHYILVLDEQAQRLQEELSELTAPFVMLVGGRMPRPFTPDVVQRALDADLSEIRRDLRALETDLASFKDINHLKASLRHYRVGQSGGDELDMLESLLMDSLRGRRR